MTRYVESSPECANANVDLARATSKIVVQTVASKNRRATIQFATVGQKKIILSHSLLRPAR
ncbi:MAG: hypothetical protein WD971_14145 [Pirellulales bacterium]